MTDAPAGDVPKERFNPPFHRTLGVQMKIGENREGVAFIEVDPEKHYGNRWAHGGMVGVLADIASGIAIAVAMGEDGRQAIDGTVELKVNFLRKVYEGDMTATARVVHLGKRLAVTNVDVTNGGVLCAKAIATFMLSRSKA
jgi:uncharacterized protein (TIGR00369 family)